MRRRLPAPLVVLDHGHAPTSFQVRCCMPGCDGQRRWSARPQPAQASYAAHRRRADRWGGAAA
jgi:hypothetical protein